MNDKTKTTAIRELNEAIDQLGVIKAGQLVFARATPQELIALRKEALAAKLTAKKPVKKRGRKPKQTEELLEQYNQAAKAFSEATTHSSEALKASTRMIHFYQSLRKLKFDVKSLKDTDEVRKAAQRLIRERYPLKKSDPQ